MNPQLIELGKRVVALRHHFIQTDGLLMVRDIEPSQGHRCERLSLGQMKVLSDGWFPDLSDEQTLNLLIQNVRTVWDSEPIQIHYALPGLWDYPAASVHVSNEARSWTRHIHCRLTVDDEFQIAECLVIALEVKASESCT